MGRGSVSRETEEGQRARQENWEGFSATKNNRLAIRKMQIRTAMQYHFAHTKVAPIKMSDNDECG